MSKDKYLSIFSPQMEAIVSIILQIVFTRRALSKIGEYLTTIHRSGGKYPTLATDTEVNTCLVYTKTVR